MWPVGGQRVGIVSQTAVLDGGGNPVVNELFEEQTTESVVWVDNCSFEQLLEARPKTVEIEAGGTAITYENVWVFLPVTADGQVPAVDDSDQPVMVSSIKSGQHIRYGGVDYPIRGDGFVENDMRGRPSFMFCLCEYQQG